EKALGPGESAALIVLQSDAYASRPWCRREVLAFRKPRPVASAEGSSVWSMSPTLVVQTMRGPALSRTIAELGTSPCIRWDPGREATIVTTLLREVLLAAFHLGLARQVPPAPGRVVINWRPDIPSLRSLQTQCLENGTGSSTLREVVYPQQSTPRLELDALQTYFPAITFSALTEGGATTELTSPPRPSAPGSENEAATLPFQDRVVGLSISESDDLASLGFAHEHLREALLSLARPLVRLGADLAYGGHLNDPETSFTRDLIYLIAGEQRDAASPTARSSRSIGRLYNPQPWPHSTGITVADEARWVDVCTFVRISQETAGFVSDPAKGFQEILPEPAAAGEPVSTRLAFNRAIVNSALRRLMIQGIPVPGTPSFRRPRLAASVLLGGKTRGFTSVIPGVFEEALQALRSGIPVFLVGGFGGAAARLAEYLLGHDSEAFDLDYLRQPEPPGPGRTGSPACLTEIEAGFAEFRVPQGALPPGTALDELRRLLDQARSSQLKSLNNGLGPEENRLLFSTQDATVAARLVQTGLLRVTREPQPA
ncbi:MAG: hypothetical protein AB7O66_22045, partial [Limisphaerales bacterium]